MDLLTRDRFFQLGLFILLISFAVNFKKTFTVFMAFQTDDSICLYYLTNGFTEKSIHSKDLLEKDSLGYKNCFIEENKCEVDFQRKQCVGQKICDAKNYFGFRNEHCRLYSLKTPPIASIKSNFFPILFFQISLQLLLISLIILILLYKKKFIFYGYDLFFKHANKIVALYFAFGFIQCLIFAFKFIKIFDFRLIENFLWLREYEQLRFFFNSSNVIFIGFIVVYFLRKYKGLSSMERLSLLFASYIGTLIFRHFFNFYL